MRVLRAIHFSTPLAQFAFRMSTSTRSSSREALCVLGLLLAAAWVALRRAYPPERLAAMLADSITAATGRAFRIDGELRLRVLPSLTIAAIAVETRQIAVSASGEINLAQHEQAQAKPAAASPQAEKKAPRHRLLPWPKAR